MTYFPKFAELRYAKSLDNSLAYAAHMPIKRC
jgi:hypothetical protein